MTNTTPPALTAIRKQYNKQQLCEMLSLSERTLENMVKAGQFYYQKPRNQKCLGLNQMVSPKQKRYIC